jgi:hypothetical protein
MIRKLRNQPYAPKWDQAPNLEQEEGEKVPHAFQEQVVFLPESISSSSTSFTFCFGDYLIMSANQVILLLLIFVRPSDLFPIRINLELWVL